MTDFKYWDPIETSFNKWARLGHFSRAIARDHDTYTWIWNFHDAHNFDSHTSDLERSLKKIIERHLGQLSNIFL